MPKISVIIPVYNVQEWLPECLDSILTQTLVDVEIICIDDGSTDASWRVLKDYASTYANVHVLWSSNEGVACARNKGLAVAQGEYIIFMDSDDFYPNPLCLEALYTAAVENNAEIVAGSLTHFEQGRGFFNSNYSEYLFKEARWMTFEELQFDWGFTRHLFKRELLERNHILFPIRQCYEDPLFLIKAIDAVKAFYVIPLDVYAYRTGHKPESFNTNELYWIDYLRGIEHMLIWSAKKQYSKFHNTLVNRLTGEWMFERFRAFTSPLNYTVLSHLARCQASVDLLLLRREDRNANGKIALLDLFYHAK